MSHTLPSRISKEKKPHTSNQLNVKVVSIHTKHKGVITGLGMEEAGALGFFKRVLDSRSKNTTTSADSSSLEGKTECVTRCVVWIFTEVYLWVFVVHRHFDKNKKTELSSKMYKKSRLKRDLKGIKVSSLE